MKPVRWNPQAIGEFLVVAVCTGAFCIYAVGVIVALVGPNGPGTRDYIEYWSAGQRIVRGADPYDAGAILRLERAGGMPVAETVQLMPNPPWALPLVFPLGALSPGAGELLWEAMLIACLLASVAMARAMYAAETNLVHLLGIGFAPALNCLLAGQLSLFLLLGLTLFLYFHRQRPWLAGAALWLCLAKPHLFLPFGVVLLLWVAHTRNWRILAGTGLATGMASAAATAIDPHIWAQYARMMGSARVDLVPLPCLSVLLRHAVFPHTFWLQCTPAMAACAWAAVWFWKRRDGWEWSRDGSMLIPVGVMVAPYFWFMDEAAMIPALLYGAYRMGTYLAGSRGLIAALALLSAAVEIAALRGVKLDSAFYLWTAPAFAMWLALATWRAREAARPEAAFALGGPPGR